jgi:predicted methyltransferase
MSLDIKSHPVDRQLKLCKRRSWLLIIAGVINLAGCVSAPVLRTAEIAPDTDIGKIYQRAANSPLRTAEDHASDASRKPITFLSFTQVLPGMQVLDLAAGGGNTSELLALVVGEGGKVYAQNQAPRVQLERRLINQPQANLIPVVQPFDDAIPPTAPPLDLITINLSYHDIANLPIDRIKMNRRLLAGLKPNGHLVVVDHAAAAGSGAQATKTLHRIDQALVQAEFQQAGFKLEAVGDYLRNTADTHDKKSADLDRMSDKFALRFVKPN